MAKQPRTKMTGKEARYIVKQNNINQAWLAEQMGISPQALNSRFNADVFSKANMLLINQAIKKDIFGIADKPTEILAAGTIPIYDLRLSAGYGNGLYDDGILPVEHVSIPGLQGCVGLTVYGDSMTPRYRSGDIVFVRPIPNVDGVDWGHPYTIITKTDRFIKLLYPSDDGDSIKLVSSNEETRKDGSRIYPDKEVQKAEILYLYKVVGSLRREQL